MSKGVKFKVLSLFSSCGFADFGIEESGSEICVANELLDIRAKAYNYWHPKSKIISGDIVDPVIKKQIIDASLSSKVDFIIGTPPCQGVSLIGKNKTNEQMLLDKRNYLFFHLLDVVDAIKPKAVLIENVPRFLKIQYEIDGELFDVETIIRKKYCKDYNIKCEIFDTQYYGIPQHRERAIVRMWKDDYEWNDPKKQKIITVREAIGSLPSLEAGEKSNIKNHYARMHTAEHIEMMKHTPTGHSAFENKFYYPKNKQTGERLKGYPATYKRIEWDKPAPTITMRNDCISSQSNVHPGRLLSDGTYSDARVLTPRELFILSSINPDLDIPEFLPDSQLRYLIGEGVPPRLIYLIMKGLKKK